MMHLTYFGIFPKGSLDLSDVVALFVSQTDAAAYHRAKHNMTHVIAKVSISMQLDISVTPL